MTSVLECVFRTILNMSTTAGVAIAVVMLIRLALKKAPKAITGTLWFAVLFRLLCPVSFQSTVSLFSLRGVPTVVPSSPVLGTVGTQAEPVNTPVTNSSVTASVAPASFDVVSSSSLSVMEILAVVWAIVAIGFMIYGIMSYLNTVRRVRTATLVEGNIYESDTITSPFVCGFLRPKIYLPLSLKDTERIYILMHERMHISRRDYIIKPVWFIAVCLHWFNPLVWAAYFIMGRDIEMSCDEAVIRKMGDGIRVDYSSSLLALSAPRKIIAGSPLAFGESNTFSRIKNVLNFKKPAFWVILLAVVATGATSIVLASNPIEKTEPSLADQYMAYKTDYIGDNSKVGGIISLLEFPEDISVDHFELQTDTEPYGVTIFLNVDNVAYDTLTACWKNAAILFALVGNVSTVSFSYDLDLTNTYSYSKAEIDAMYEMDVRSCTENVEAFKSLLEATPSNAWSVTAALYDTLMQSVDTREACVIVEENLEIIMSSPAYSSAPGDYIDAHPKEYEIILKLGQPALEYMFSCFENGEDETLKGHIMVALCQDLLGPGYSFPDEYLTPAQWYERIQASQETDLPDYVYTGDDPVLRLVYETETAQYQGWDDGFTVVAPHVLGSYEEDGYLKVFVTTYAASYHLYGNTVDMYTGSIVPAAITYMINADGSYSLSTYEQAKDGSLFGSSIENYCTMPVSGEMIPGLADKIIAHCSKNDLKELQNNNLSELLKSNGITDFELVQ